MKFFRLFFLTSSSVFFLGILPFSAHALGCCMVLHPGKTVATTKEDVAQCFTLWNFQNCNDYKTNNNVQAVWKDGECSSVDICSGKLPKNCCVTTNKTTGGSTCTPSPDASACSIYVDYAKSQITKKQLGDPYSFSGKLVTGSCDGNTACNPGGAAVTPAATPAKPATITVPALQIPIPGLQPFTSPGGKVDEGGYLIPWVGQYMTGLYIFVLGAVGTIAIAVIIWAGIIWSTAGDSSERISKAKTLITNAVTGLLLALGSFLILYTINPELVRFKALQISVVKRLTIDEAWFAEHGTGDPTASAGAASKAGGASFPSQNKPLPLTGDNVNISAVPFDKSLGWAGNIKNYCNFQGASGASTYEEKAKYLAAAVLGWEKICVQNRLCAYCQTCQTLPDGNIVGNPAPNYAVTQFIQRNIQDGLPEKLWEGQPECLAAWKKDPVLTNGIKSCQDPVNEVYKKYFIDKFVENKMFGGDCGSFANTLYACAGAPWKRTPTEEAYDQRTKQPVNTVYLSEKSLGKFTGQSGSILSAHMNENLTALAEPKGGFKFGDLVYICCGGKTGTYSAHWFMYTGGRADVPFSFIEMGGGSGVTIAGLGQISGVHTQPKDKTIQDYVSGKTKSGSYNAAKGVIYVWRPYAD